MEERFNINHFLVFVACFLLFYVQVTQEIGGQV
jgi:hypothetical protein